jgi:hypothetical protein
MVELTDAIISTGTIASPGDDVNKYFTISSCGVPVADLVNKSRTKRKRKSCWVIK